MAEVSLSKGAIFKKSENHLCVLPFYLILLMFCTGTQVDLDAVFMISCPFLTKLLLL